MRPFEHQPLLKKTVLFLIPSLVAVTAGIPSAAGQAENTPNPRPDIVLITLDTVRADHVGDPKVTPFFATLANRGARFNHALSVAPLTLPAHATLLTGRLPTAHGAVDNGTSTLASNIPTLASVLANEGYQTAAIIGSRVLDRRFGLDLGFQWYDDRMTAEALGEHGYPERNAEEVTSAALSWLDSADRDQPLFLWVHYYDAHAPYSPPAKWQTATGNAYAGEIAFVDDQIRRLVTEGGLDPSQKSVIAVVGDHGESLGEHGEAQHGIFLYGATLDVPLIIAGGNVPAGLSIDDTVAIRRVAATLHRLASVEGASIFPGPALPIVADPDGKDDSVAIFSETRMTESAYGWSRLRAVTSQEWRYIEAPRSELYDLKNDPKELVNLVDDRKDQVARLQQILADFEAENHTPENSSPVLDPEISEALIQLGYLSGMSTTADGGDGIDPKDGIQLLDEFARAKLLLDRGQPQSALAALQRLVTINPGNVPFQTQLARAYMSTGNLAKAISTYQTAVAINPNLDFLHANLARAELQSGRLPTARRAFERAIELNPRFADAWLGLAEIAARQGNPGRERQLLQEAVEANTCSAVIEVRLAQIALGERDFNTAAHFLRSAAERNPQAPLTWMLLGETEISRQHFAEAADAFWRAAAIPGVEFPAGLALARVLERMGDLDGALLAALDALKHAGDSGRETQARTIIDRLRGQSPQSP